MGPKPVALLYAASGAPLATCCRGQLPLGFGATSVRESAPEFLTAGEQVLLLVYVIPIYHVANVGFHAGFFTAGTHSS